MLHISDLHPDVFYSMGSPTLCNQPVCCRDDVKALNGSKKAGYWGSLAECDVPLPTFNLFL
jgi:sphingomyelin phosphodiesterase